MKWMAKGWESKSVEAQMEAAASEIRRPQRPTLTPAQVDLLRKKENLVLSRTHVQRELASSANPRYRLMLQRALADLEAQINALEPVKAAAARA
jgi:hypothetical protein